VVVVFPLVFNFQ
jgi:hypothetical protein